jgi:hypothetical protein
MILRHWCAAIALFTGAVTSAVAQSDLTPSLSAKQHAPRLVEIMTAAQLQHLKLWFAGRAKNWDLAAYELRQLRDSLAEAAALYPGIPISNVTTMMVPLRSISDALAAKDSHKFASSMRELTDGCNACHSSMDRGFVVMKLPTDQPPPANQMFAPQEKAEARH